MNIIVSKFRKLCLVISLKTTNIPLKKMKVHNFFYKRILFYLAVAKRALRHKKMYVNGKKGKDKKVKLVENKSLKKLIIFSFLFKF